MWTKYSLKMDFTTELCGSVPKNQDIIETWITVRKASDARHRQESRDGIGPDGRKPQAMELIIAEREETMPEIDGDEEMKKSWVGFSKDEHGLFVRGGNVRAHLKDCADVLGKYKKSKAGGGILNFRFKFVSAIYVSEDRLRILDVNGNAMHKPTDWREATMRVKGPTGPRQCLKRVDYCHPAKIECTILLCKAVGEIGEHDVRDCLEYGAVHGFGQDRSLQFGRYDWTLKVI